MPIYVGHLTNNDTKDKVKVFLSLHYYLLLCLFTLAVSVLSYMCGYSVGRQEGRREALEIIWSEDDREEVQELIDNQEITIPEGPF